jgi:hypothetical protein
VSIPSDDPANYTFWLNVTSSESGTIVYDRLFVEVRSTSGALLRTLATCSNVNTTTVGNYSQKWFSLASWRGQTVRLQFRATTDFSLPTSFRVDDVPLKALLKGRAAECRPSLHGKAVRRSGVGGYAVPSEPRRRYATRIAPVPRSANARLKAPPITASPQSKPSERTRAAATGAGWVSTALRANGRSSGLMLAGARRSEPPR